MGIGSNKIASLQYEEVASKNTFNVTIVTDAGSRVTNTQVHCTTNGQNYTTNSSGQIPQTIEVEAEVKSLTFTWSASQMGWSTINGHLQEGAIITYNYTATATISSGNSFDGNCIATIQTSTESAGYRINSPAVVGEYITIGTREYVIAQADSSIVYAILRYWEEDVIFDNGGSVRYNGSDIAATCSSWYMIAVPAVWRTSANAFTKVTTEGVSVECFIPTKSQLDSGWDYFNSDERRIFKDSNNDDTYPWWTSTERTSSAVWGVSAYGNFTNYGYGGPSDPRGFRPALAIKRSLFTS